MPSDKRDMPLDALVVNAGDCRCVSRCRWTNLHGRSFLSIQIRYLVIDSQAASRVNETNKRMEIGMANLDGKVGIVTGGGTGIGRATALAMAKAGAVVVIGNRDATKGEEVVALIRQAGGRAVFQKTDVSKPADVKALVERAVKEFGRLDIAHYNAGVDGQ